MVKAITTVVPGVDEGHAKNCFNTSRTLGVAIITSTLKEHAEFYSEQLYRWSCKTRIEPDSTVA